MKVFFQQIFSLFFFIGNIFEDLLSRMSKIVGADCPDIDDVLKKLWLKNQTYSFPYEVRSDF